MLVLKEVFHEMRRKYEFEVEQNVVLQKRVDELTARIGIFEESTSEGAAVEVMNVQEQPNEVLEPQVDEDFSVQKIETNPPALSDHQSKSEISKKSMIGKSAKRSTSKAGGKSESREKRFKCDLCSIDFRQATTLEQHMTTHQEQKYFVCEICMVGFTKAATLQKHMSSKHSMTCPGK